MGFSNPFQMMAQMMPQNRQSPPSASVPPIDPNQFRQFALTLNDQSLAQFAQLARQRGISEQDIQAGIRYIKSL